MIIINVTIKDAKNIVVIAQKKILHIRIKIVLTLYRYFMM